MTDIDKIDDAKWYVSYLAEMSGALPPYLVEIVMKDGSHYFVHSGNGKNEETQSVCINVWDLRALNGEARETILEKISEPGAWEHIYSNDFITLHPLLSIGRLRCGLDEVSHVVEWWSRTWVSDENQDGTLSKGPFGFTLPERPMKQPDKE